jgi:hypothetical protein
MAFTGVRVDSVQLHQFTVEFPLQISVKNIFSFYVDYSWAQNKFTEICVGMDPIE